MTVKTRFDLVAFFGAAFLAVAVALFVAWSYSLDVTGLLRFPGLFYFEMFAAVVGMPMYFLIRYVRSQRMHTNPPGP